MPVSPFPVLLIDLDIVRANISRMRTKAEKNNIEFRPHFKTHQSREIGRIFKEFGVKGITVSSLKMAKYFADDGWNDITIAFPANVLAAEYYSDIAKDCKLKTLVISEEAVLKLDSKLNAELGLYIEIDPAYGRSGIPVSETAKISSLIKGIENSEHCYVAGFYSHSGHTYKARSAAEVQEIAGESLELLSRLKADFTGIPVCFGDTPSCSVLEDFGPADQISPGNFVFYDWMQVQIGACTPEEIAVVMRCPVIEKFDERKQILIHGGAVHFSKDSVETNSHINFGQLLSPSGSSKNYLQRISQEHGVMNCDAETFDSLSIGDTVDIYPIHSCLTADLMREYHTRDGKVIDHMNGNLIS